jgi:hypothetical protein
VVQASEEILNLTTTNVSVQQSERRGTAESSVWPTQPNAGRFESTKRGSGNMSNVGNAIESIGLHRREEALVPATSKSSGWNSNDGAHIPNLTTERSREDFQGGIWQTVANDLNKVCAFGDGAENLATAEQVCDASCS